MKALILLVGILVLAATTVFIACGDDDDPAPSGGDDASGDDGDDADDTGDTGDDASDDVADDDVGDDSADDAADDDAGCPDASGEPVTLCNPVYDSTPDYSAAFIGWPIPMVTVTYDGAILAGFQLVFDCSSYSLEISLMIIPLTIYVGGAETGVINAQGFGLPSRQVGPFYENQQYTCRLYVADGVGATVSNEVPITVTLGPKP